MPFLAPALPFILGLGGAAGAIASNRAAGRATDAQANQGQDRLAQDRYQNELAGSRLNLQAPSYRAHNAVQGDILSNAQDFHFNPGFGTGSTGGLRPSIFSPQTRQLGALQSAQALTGAQTNGGNVAGAPPQVTSLPQPNWLDKVLGVAGTIGGLGAGYVDSKNLQSALPYATAKKQPPPYDGDPLAGDY